MKHFLTVCLLSFVFPLLSQTDTTVYNIVDESARFPGCENLDTTIAFKNQCSQKGLLMFFNQNVQYPLMARDSNIQGTVAIAFVVEPDGYISNIAVAKDIGGGCGNEAKRVALGMNDALKKANVKWEPGKKGGKVVRSKVVVPIKFKLEEPADFVIVNRRDSVWVKVDDSLSYQGGNAALEQYLLKNIKFPDRYKDSCVIGTMDMTIMASPNGGVKVLDLSDYWNLGNEFRWEAVKLATSTWGQWKPATRKGRQVPSSVDISLTYLPKGANCTQVISKFDQANNLADQGSLLFNEGKQEAGLAKLNEALALFPNNANFLYLRGQAYMNMNFLPEACEDFKKVRATVYLEIVEQMIPLICK